MTSYGSYSFNAVTTRSKRKSTPPHASIAVVPTLAKRMASSLAHVSLPLPPRLEYTSCPAKKSKLSDSPTHG